MDTFDINAEVKSALPAVLERMRGELAKRIAQEAQGAALDEVRKATREWALEVLVPEIKAQLEAGRDGMLKQAATIAQQLGEAVGTALTAQANKSLASSNVVSELAQKLFRGY